MLRIRIIGFAFVVVLVMSAVAASSASAAHLWLIGGKLVASPVKIHSLGLFLITDHNPLNINNPSAIHCHFYADGTVGPHGLDLVLAVTAELLGKNDKLTCAFDKTGGCESSPAPLALVGLQWHTELYLTATGEVRDMIVSDGAGNPGWKVTCKAPLLGMITDECTVALTSTSLLSVAGGVDGIFDVKSETDNCKVGGEAVRNGAGLVRGSILLESPSAGAPLTFD